MKKDSEVVLLDPATDAPIGTMEKLAAHQEGRYHAAISILLVDPQGRHILQQRSASKYHAPGLWSNACCSHPYPDETNETAVVRRLEEELGIRCQPSHFGTVRYRAFVPAPTSACGSLIEYERVELYCAEYSEAIQPNDIEVSAIRTESFRNATLARADYTPWFKLYMRLFGPHIRRFMTDTISRRARPVDFGFHDLTVVNI
ncbi:isopentenyl-diphosphate Delta-isomerase [Pseudaminobacter arsenicus]|uniref:isopentenyl-diphosphate Delta-isomerase n=1 Tax=Borborobacter arsenicus TaxID=1851146 RepID=A0A432V3D5_9HYPH|nr:isopentenyl-diphosphate Delta-isomerase [Pseudaminobacter arsenicus]RUM96635.1 isopentenyl-diphosphate Delta-isomerase [Pseudaminobacter arsenicus]